ncbi:MAG: ribosome small subunit-dependent GTPase A [Sporomusaceae bacterium]|nr:ribosome small subunit-dependent GTPase A [Sporomusaceae bacterium]
MNQGTVIKAYNSFYYVQTGHSVIACTLRGRFKQERFSLLVGDIVQFEHLTDTKGVIEAILPRRSLLKRPMVANVDQVILAFAAVNPDINTALVDRFLALVELSGLPAILCVNKMDMADAAAMTELAGRYRQIGYPVTLVSAKQRLNLEQLQALLIDKVTVFAGPSGAGKSSLLNALQPGLTLTTGEVSKKIGRGRHTTRYAQLLPLQAGGFVVDTPGFSFTEFNNIEENELMRCFREFLPLLPQCRFSSCLHLKEPQCAVKEAVEQGVIFPQRYEAYTALMAELREKRKGY